MASITGALRGRGLGSVGGVTALTTAVTLGFTTLSARFLSQTDYAALAFFLSASALLATTFDLGVSVRTITAYDHQTESWRDPPLKAYWSGQTLSYGIGATIGTVVVAFAFTTHLGPLFLVAAPVAWSSGLATFMSATYQARRAWAPRARLNAGFSLVRVAPALLIVFVLRRVDVTVVAFALGGALAVLLSLRRWLQDASASPDGLAISGRAAWSVWRASRWYALAGALGSVMVFAPMAFANLRGTIDDQAVVGLALMAGGAGLVLLNIGMTTLLPLACDRTLPARTYLRDVAITVAPLAAVLIGGALVTPFLLPRIFGATFQAAVVPVELLLASYLVLLLANPIAFLHYRRDRQRFLSAIDGIQLAAFILFAPAFARTFSIPVATGSAVLMSTIVANAIGVGRIALDLRRP